MQLDHSLIDQWKGARTRIARGENAGEYLPTWQVGQSQPILGDLRRYLEEGYGKDSLIFSCVANTATSFAPLKPQVVRPNGVVVQNHRMVQLLGDPNDEQDGQDFAELNATFFEAAGNCYIEKLPISASPERRAKFAGFPIQELNPIRPDYVTVEPGARRDLDMYLVTVAGRVVKRIPRRNMIHVHEPLVVNDFYGLSKLARVINEGSITRAMTDFELSFFRNAGVPMGILSVKGLKNKEEREEIKSSFRKAYNGFRKWFDLLVLNAETASYVQLGVPQNQMEMEGTRDNAEAHICSVYGTPGIIVGARFATSGQSQQPYEEAEHAFWAEKMVPFSLRFGRAWQKFLLPDFAVQADRGAEVTYDFTNVRALQEDRSRKLREVVRMINTGAFTVNQALMLNGMAQVENGDFYVRSGNQVEVKVLPNGDHEIIMVTPQPGGGSQKEATNPLEGAARVPALALPRANWTPPEPDAVEEMLSIFDKAWRRDD